MKPALLRFGTLCGILAPLFWAAAIVGCGLARPGYSHYAQYISELGERASATELAMRYAGFVPTGLMHAAFAAALAIAFARHRLAWIAAALLALNGLGRVGAGFFPCEPGCVGAGVAAQQWHRLSAGVGFIALIGATIAWGMLLRRIEGWRAFGVLSLACGVAGLAFLGLMLAGAGPGAAAGLYERLSSGVLSGWVMAFALALHREAGGHAGGRSTAHG